MAWRLIFGIIQPTFTSKEISMRLCTFYQKAETRAGILIKGGVLPLAASDIKQVIEQYSLDQLQELAQSGTEVLSPAEISYAAPYRHPPKIWGIGLNYQEHAADLDEVSPEEEPASFMKPATTIIDPGETIILPRQSNRVTGEAELGVIIGRRCKDVPLDQAQEVIFGYTTIIDMTAEDILRRNPRFLTRSKSFDTFFSFGPVVVTPDEIEDVTALTVQTIRNGELAAENVVRHMMFPPFELVAFHSQVMTLEPGDIISTGTPGAVHIRHGDEIMCRIAGLGWLQNPVIDSKVSHSS
jgi:2-keto-4-pentenoate hydratase/2-oxohepta-3-ene-1,7-dioic acid hydratase in catechol pathway